MQTIVIFDGLFDRYAKKLILFKIYFPGGMLPSPSTLERIAEKNKFNFSTKIKWPTVTIKLWKHGEKILIQNGPIKPSYSDEFKEWEFLFILLFWWF